MLSSVDIINFSLSKTDHINWLLLYYLVSPDQSEM
jgi:hypothetical protein